MEKKYLIIYLNSKTKRKKELSAVWIEKNSVLEKAEKFMLVKKPSFKKINKE